MRNLDLEQAGKLEVLPVHINETFGKAMNAHG
jgi:hypothetical protein